MILDEFAASPRYKTARKFAFVTALIWIAAIIVFFTACGRERANRILLDDSSHILASAEIIKSHPHQELQGTGGEPVTLISDAVEQLGLKERVAAMSSSQSGTVLQVNRLYSDEAGVLIDRLQACGLVVTTAEIRALASQKDGRLLNVTLTIGEETK